MVRGQKFIVEILAHAFVIIVSIYKVLLINEKYYK